MPWGEIEETVCWGWCQWFGGVWKGGDGGVGGKTQGYTLCKEQARAPCPHPPILVAWAPDQRGFLPTEKPQASSFLSKKLIFPRGGGVGWPGCGSSQRKRPARAERGRACNGGKGRSVSGRGCRHGGEVQVPWGLPCHLSAVSSSKAWGSCSPSCPGPTPRGLNEWGSVRAGGRKVGRRSQGLSLLAREEGKEKNSRM